jgi:hypothetical protein
MRKKLVCFLAATFAAALLATPLLAAHSNRGDARSGSTIIAMRDYFQT